MQQPAFHSNGLSMDWLNERVEQSDWDSLMESSISSVEGVERCSGSFSVKNVNYI